MKTCIAFPIVALVSLLAPDLAAAQHTSGLSFCADGPPCLNHEGGSGTTAAQITFSGEAQNETIIVVDPSNPLVVIAAFNDYRLGTGFAGQGVAVSSDAGATWTDLGIAVAQPAGFPTRGGDPGLAFDSQSRAYYSFISGGPGDVFTRDNGVFVASSTDGGNTWSSAVTVASNSAAEPLPFSLPFEDKPFIAADEYSDSPFTDRVYVSWTRFYEDVYPGTTIPGGGDIMFSFSTDNGATWSTPLRVTTGPDNGGFEVGKSSVQGSEPEVASNGDVYIAYFSLARTEVVRSTDGGVTFGAPTHPFGAVPGSAGVFSPLPNETFRVNAFPNCETDPTRPGNVYCVSARDPDGLNDNSDGGDIIFARSTDDGGTWGPILTLNDDGPGSNQIFPWMAVDSVTGHICVIWYDTRNDAGNHNLDVYGAFSFDGGQIFTSNIRMTTVSFDPDTGQFPGDIFIGDYNGLGAGANIFHALWTDTSTGEQEIAISSKDAGGPLDIFLLVDSSSSFDDILASFQAQAASVISSVLATNPDTRFGLGKYGDYPISPFGDSDDSPYQRTRDLTFDSGVVLSAIAEIGIDDTLYAGTDVEDFAPIPILPDLLAVVQVEGSTVLNSALIDTTFHFNGLASTGTSDLYAGDPFSSFQLEMTTGGNLISSVMGPLPASCCNEDIAFDGTYLWRAHHLNGPLFQYFPDGTFVNSFSQTDVVGATFVGSTLWITHWGLREVGTFVPGIPPAGTFTFKFSTSTNAGALAYDSRNKILWVGQQGGMVSAWDLTTPTPTAIAGSAIQPFGSISQTVDGLAFIPSFGGGGGDPRQSQLVALFQAGSGLGQTVPIPLEADFQIPAEQQVNFREDALKLYLLWSNSEFHVETDEGDTYPGPTFAAAVFALGGAKVAGIHNGGGGLRNLSDLAQQTGALAPPGGVDIDGDGIVDIDEGEPLVFEVDGTGGAPAPNIGAIVEATLPGPTIAVDDLIAEVEALGLQKGLEKSLVAKLNLVAKKIELGQNQVAANVLIAFIDHVGDLEVAGKIALADATNLIIKARLLGFDLE